MVSAADIINIDALVADVIRQVRESGQPTLANLKKAMTCVPRDVPKPIRDEVYEHAIDQLMADVTQRMASRSPSGIEEITTKRAPQWHHQMRTVVAHTPTGKSVLVGNSHSRESSRDRQYKS